MYRFVILLLAFLSARASPTTNIENSDDRMMGGDFVQLGRAPYMASLRSNNVHFCGGTIVSNRYILTAGQCTYGRSNAGDISIIVGTIIRTGAGVTYTSSAAVNHPGFDPDSLANDLGLVLTSTAIIFTVNVQSAYIHPNLDVNGKSVDMAGWGIGYGTVEPLNLKGITTKIISNDECRLLHGAHNVWRITNNKICTSTIEMEGICYGDEGGAIVSGYELIGVASWHQNCDVGIPNVYERIAPHRLWILSHIVL